ncbi:N-acetyltransferase [Ktedonobacteria bacterium brp13]|nr:N-acetyltransferase [Ktedonobacteria bacterium brp13]
MTLTRHPFRSEADMPRILDLILRMPLSCRHVIDLPWRLSSPAINEGRDAAFWEDSERQLVGFAAWQYYWAALDFFILPGPEAQDVAAQLFAWADGRFRERDAERGWPLPYWVEFRDDDLERQQLVEAHGFLHEEGDRYVLLQHSLANLPPVPTLPAGFTLRLLAGEQEVAAYSEVHRAAFESTSMTPEWRARTIHTPPYRPELDLVVTAPDGSLAGFCVGWFVPERRIAQIEPLGVHPRFHQSGIGRILLLEILRRFKEHGATSAIVETNVERTPARRAYESVGFQQVHTIRGKGKWLNQPV